MPNYAKMYAALCGHVSDALDAIDNGAALEEVQFILNKALIECEDMYIADSEPETSEQL